MVRDRRASKFRVSWEFNESTALFSVEPTTETTIFAMDLSKILGVPHLEPETSHELKGGCFNWMMNRIFTSGQISIIPKPELRGFWGSSLTKPPFRVTSADVVIICPVYMKNPCFTISIHENMVPMEFQAQLLLQELSANSPAQSLQNSPRFATNGMVRVRYRPPPKATYTPKK